MSCDDISAQGGWLVENPQGRHEADPEKFWLPEPHLLSRIASGWTARLLLWFVDESEGKPVPQCERMWALVESRHEDVIRGRLTSPPVSTRAPLEMGELIQFSVSDCIDAIEPTADWAEHREFLEAIHGGDEAFERYQQSRRERLADDPL